MSGAVDEQASSVARVHQALRERILSGEYQPGSRLVLSRLAVAHEMSVIPMREALYRLEAERLVRLERNRGATVTELSLTDMRDIYETRLVLETHATRVATSQITEAQLDQVEDALDGMAAGFAAGDHRTAYNCHQAFHFSLYERAGSEWTMHLIRQLWSGAERYVRLAASVRPAPEEFVAEHRAIFEAVKAGDADGAARYVEENLRTTERLLDEAYSVTGRRNVG